MGSSLLGFYQEYRASAAVEQLKKRLALICRVVRDGIESRHRWLETPSPQGALRPCPTEAVILKEHLRLVLRRHGSRLRRAVIGVADSRPRGEIEPILGAAETAACCVPRRGYTEDCGPALGGCRQGGQRVADRTGPQEVLHIFGLSHSRKLLILKRRRDVRVVEGARLEIEAGQPY